MGKLAKALGRCVHRGWQVVALEHGWRLQHPDTAIEVYLQETPHWFSLMRPLKEAELALFALDGEPIQLYQQMLLQNRHMFMTRYALDSEGLPLMLADVPQHSASTYLLEIALEAICGPKTGGSALLGRQVKTAGGSVTLHVEEDGLSAETLSQYVSGIRLQMWGWGRPVGQPHIEHLWYKNHMRRFDIFFTTTKSWSYFELPLIEEGTLEAHGMDTVVDVHTYQLFLKYILYLNYHYYMAKIALNQENQVLLLLEMPTSALDLPLFKLAASTLSNYIDHYAQEILVMALLEPHQQLFKTLALSKSLLHTPYVLGGN